VPFVGGRTKKLKLALRFHQTSAARWSCEQCRSAGLEKQRGCGFLKEKPNRERVVWIQGDVYSSECPKSAITGESMRWLELFAARQGENAGLTAREGSARDAEAMVLLRRWMTEERSDD
jgi:hypothetical protein